MTPAQQYIIVTILACLTVAVLYYFQMIRIIEFRKYNRLDFQLCLLDSSKLDKTTKEALLRMYLLKEPSYTRLFFTGITLSRKRYYSQDDIELYFTPFEEHPTLNTPFFVNEPEYDFYSKAH